MIAILLNVVVFLLYCEIAVSDLRICSDPNEEFMDRGCEIECKTDLISPCQACDDGSEQNLTSGCFCKKGTFRDSESNKCISNKECTKKLCGDNQTFTEYFFGAEICEYDGSILIYDLFKCITACECNEGFIRSCTTDGECITDSECKMRETTQSR